MASIPFYLKTNGKWQVGSSPMAVNGSLRVVQEGENLTFYGSGNNVPIIEKTHVTDISKNVAGDTYATVQEFEDATKDFFHKASATGGGSTVYVDKTSQNLQANDFARYKDGHLLKWERWNGTAWEVIDVKGGSNYTDRFVADDTIGKLSGFYYKDVNGIERSWLRKAHTLPDTVVLGSADQDMIMLGGKLIQSKRISTTQIDDIQLSVTEEVTTDKLDFELTQSELAMVSKFSAQINTQGETVSMRLVTYSTPARNKEDIVWNSCSNIEYISETANTRLTNDGTAPFWVDARQAFYTNVNNTVYVTAYTSKPVIHKGATVNGQFVPYLRHERVLLSTPVEFATKLTARVIDNTSTIAQRVIKDNELIIIGNLTAHVTLELDAECNSTVIVESGQGVYSIFVRQGVTELFEINQKDRKTSLYKVGNAWKYNVANFKLN